MDINGKMYRNLIPGESPVRSYDMNIIYDIRNCPITCWECEIRIKIGYRSGRLIKVVQVANDMYNINHRPSKNKSKKVKRLNLEIMARLDL